MSVDERDAVAQQFGVAAEQVKRDHLISHLLGFLSRDFGDRVHFIGRTALARTHLPDGRLSEDIDLIAIADRKGVATDLDAALPKSLARTYGRLTLDGELSRVPDTRPTILRTTAGLSVRLQLLSARDRIVWPTERRALVQRYADAPPAELLVPTLPAFAASKTSTWADRHAARDLWGPVGNERHRCHRRRGSRLVPPIRADEPATRRPHVHHCTHQHRMAVAAGRPDAHHSLGEGCAGDGPGCMGPRRRSRRLGRSPAQTLIKRRQPQGEAKPLLASARLEPAPN